MVQRQTHDVVVANYTTDKRTCKPPHAKKSVKLGVQYGAVNNYSLHYLFSKSKVFNLIADWQSLDPEAAREADKYDNPIPSRELILKHLAERGAPAKREQLAEEFNLTSEEDLEALRRRLRAM